MNTKVFLLTIAVMLQSSVLMAEPIIKGKVVDASTGEEIIGVTVLLKGSVDRWAVTGLDGSFSIDTQVPSGTLVCNLIGYKDIEVEFSIPVEELRISMEPDIVMLEAAVVTATGRGRSEVAARNIEKNWPWNSLPTLRWRT